MLSPIDTHILVGILSKLAEEEHSEVELGSMVHDKSVKKERDVDITIKHPDNTTSIYRALEVKRIKKRLDVAEVEQLCAKFSDMPSIQRRGIVSASGYSKGAVKKAESHGVELYEVINWTDPRQGFHNIIFWNKDIPMTETLADWIAPPYVGFSFLKSDCTQLSEEELNKLPLYSFHGQLLFPCLSDYANNISSNVKGLWMRENLLPEGRLADIQPVKMVFKHTTESPFVIVNGIKNPIIEVTFFGVVERTAVKQEIIFRALIKQNANEPIAVVALFETSTGSLMGFLFNDKKMQHMLINIPLEDRKQKVIRKQKLS